jgi:hypothetical protein
MGFLSRVIFPPGRRGAGPAARRAVKGAGTSTSMKRVRRGMRRLRKALHGMTRSLNRNNRSVQGKKLVAVYHHGTCTVNHRSRKAASRCRRTY